ncbi:MAG: hypothetical protein IJ285_06330 [Clostridia bacterium]|nr:hypothetical protein [Oscillospiraceae bacterium]MBQ7960817.1 hypothetical protein [Clostridia bacterium]
MTRDELRGIVEGISDEQLKKILDINSSDIGKAKSEAKDAITGLEEAKRKIGELEAETESLKNSQYEAENMKDKIEELQKVIDERRLRDENEGKRTELEKRFSQAVGDAEFLNDYTRQGIFDLFEKALEMEENQGLSDGEVFESITAGSENLFAENTRVPSVVASTSGFGSNLSNGDVREIMGLSRNE